MKIRFTKISLILLIITIILGCDAVKRVPEDKQLLIRNTVIVNENEDKREELNNLIQQQPNSKVLTIPFSLHIFNLAQPNPDSIFQEKIINNPRKFNFWKALISEKQVHRLGESFWYKGKHELLKKMGDEPVIIDESRAKRSELRLKTYFFNNGFFDVKTKNSIDSVGIKRGAITYSIE
ncbi:MAG: outer membrane protein assembly factor, partial [Flavobacterium sp.]